jgi:hypothetical protein
MQWLKMVEGDSINGHHRGIEYYARIFVDRLVDGLADLELEILGPNGEEFLQDVVHTWIFKRLTQGLRNSHLLLQLTHLHHQLRLNAKINYRIH